ncbi:RNA polymerase II C-terminal domain phosphatase-like 3 [Morus notabilis]|uniref:protein-serine/threonine phosphatase n=1 Tax=Morus notabilis TaxID=981085 RepID=W9RM72_9ROSA|nr:RNA polymerase II C-terminal domain phosphatase-like 3 [Morus notabilis]
MGRIESGRVVEDVEEGEISDSASVEEISEEDFNKQEGNGTGSGKVMSVSDSNSKESKFGDSRVWTMRDLYANYPGFRGYTTGLYNLAWAQAVQNKPLNEIFVMDVDADDSSRVVLSSASPAVNSGRREGKNGVKEVEKVEKVVIDDSADEMEEGELEEGEIDLESEPTQKPAGEEAKDGDLNCEAENVGGLEVDSRRDELEKRVDLIWETLGSVNVVNAEKSFEEVCSRLQRTLESLRGVLSEKEFSFPTKDVVIQMSITAIQVVNSVFCSMSVNQKEQKKETLSRLFCSVKNCGTPLFSPEQTKEIELMISSLNPLNVLPSSGASDKEKETQIIERLHEMDSNLTNANAENASIERTSVKLPQDCVASVVHSNPITLPELLRPGTLAFKGRGLLLPLLDLHKDHDADSLPSPTREAPSCFPVYKPLGVADGIIKPVSTTAKVAPGAEESRLHRYETDALKAVSTYQQKFGRGSFLMSDRLPSPTPSEECDEEDDINQEVSSSLTSGNLRTPAIPILRPSVVTSSVPVSSPTMQGPIAAKNAAPVGSGSNSTMKASARSRDPRLRFANSDAGALDLNQRPLTAVHNGPKVEPGDPTSSRKQRIVEEPNLDGPALKRQRHAFVSAKIDVKTASGVGGWLEDNGTTGPQIMNKNQLVENAEADPRKSIHLVNGPIMNNGPNIGKEQVPVTGTSTPDALPAILKDIAVNPTIFMDILNKLGQQQLLAADAQQKSDSSKNTTHPPGTNSILGAAPLVNVAPSKASGILQTPAVSLPTTSQVATASMQDELGKIRMKPRDPRRVLHGNMLQKSWSLGHEQFKPIVSSVSCTPGNKDNLNGPVQEGQADKKQVPSQLVVQPDIARQFTKNLRNIADLMSVSQASTSPATVSQNLSSQPLPVKPDRGDVKAVVPNSEDQHSGTNSTPETTLAVPSRTPNAWGDVEHLFEGYDDEQKAAIQRERARRLEEQKKMFDAHKLCLVLDLDHTLLNSAKFVEVDSVHDEILRKKEEQDREKPQRHLFRFPHMGMWTKLRPGVWNFLEKASKLYELHLYTMGNKLYATEMAKVLDPMGTLFSGRVISRGDDGDPFDGDERVPKSKDLEGVLGMESSVVIIDDSVRVWPHNKLNLIVVERYTYFPCSRRQFGLPGPSLLEIDHDERPEQGTLASSLAVIEKIHQNFFSHHSLDEVDVRNILASEQRKILAGCRIVFSRVFPVSEVNPHLHPLWQTAEQFGAVCTTQIDDQVTHVVANSPGTDKVNWALANGKFAVHPGWSLTMMLTINATVVNIWLNLLSFKWINYSALAVGARW